MGDELGGGLALPTCQRGEAREEIPIRESVRDSEDFRVHTECVSRPISGSGQGSGGFVERDRRPDPLGASTSAQAERERKQNIDKAILE
jgi:hypothetical protein